MTDEVTRQIIELLSQTETAHGRYEATELQGVYDRNWPDWYANYLITHGLNKVLQYQLTHESLSQFLAGSFEEFKKTGPGLRWENYTALKMQEALV